MDFTYFKDTYRLIAVDLSKQKALDTDPRAIQHIVFQGVVEEDNGTKIRLKVVTKTIKNETKEQKGGFLSMLLGTLGASLLGNILSRKGIVRAGSGNKKGKGIVRAGTGKQWDF